jgi:cytochrome c oxidase assembly factor CtaG
MQVALEPLQLLPATIAGIAYALRVHRLAGTSRAVPGWRRVSFNAGLVIIVLTLTLLGDLGDELFSVHMAEHLLLADVGALLLVLGLTGPVLAPLLRVRAIDRLRLLAHPVPALGLWVLNLFAWHLPALHEAAVRSPALHALQHAAFIAAAANAWLALLGPLPKPAWFGNVAKLGYIVALRLSGAVLGNVLVFGGRPFYDVYAAGEAEHGIGAAADQNTAGAIMMIEGSILTILLFAWLFLRAARESEERQELLDLAGARGIELSERRAARAVAAGRGGELRRRLETTDSATTPGG